MNSNSTDTRKTRQFGIIALIFFGCLGSVGLLTGKFVAACFFGFLAVTGLGLSLAPCRLSPIYFNWLKIAGFLGKVTNVIALSLAYYLVITPCALILRVFKGPPLPVKPDKRVASYWVARAEPAQSKERFLKRF